MIHICYWVCVYFKRDKFHLVMTAEFVWWADWRKELRGHLEQETSRLCSLFTYILGTMCGFLLRLYCSWDYMAAATVVIGTWIHLSYCYSVFVALLTCGCFVIKANCLFVSDVIVYSVCLAAAVAATLAWHVQVFLCNRFSIVVLQFVHTVCSTSKSSSGIVLYVCKCFDIVLLLTSVPIVSLGVSCIGNSWMLFYCGIVRLLFRSCVHIADVLKT